MRESVSKHAQEREKVRAHARERCSEQARKRVKASERVRACVCVCVRERESRKKGMQDNGWLYCVLSLDNTQVVRVRLRCLP